MKVQLMEETAPPNIVIIGSSRVMKLAPSTINRLNGLAAFNAAVDSARAEDYSVLLRHALNDVAWQPQEVILGIDIEAFSNNNQIDERLLSTSQLSKHLPTAKRWIGYRNQAAALISLSQLTSSISSIKYALKGYPLERSYFDPDGLLHYGVWEQEISEGTFKPDLKTSVQEYRGRFKGFTELDKERRAVFQETLRMMSDKGIRVRSFITPLHRDVVADLRSQNFDALHTSLQRFLAEMELMFPNFSYVDYTDVAAFGGDPDLFFDGAHIRDENADRLLRHLLQGP